MIALNLKFIHISIIFDVSKTKLLLKYLAFLRKLGKMKMIKKFLNLIIGLVLSKI